VHPHQSRNMKSRAPKDSDHGRRQRDPITHRPEISKGSRRRKQGGEITFASGATLSKKMERHPKRRYKKLTKAEQWRAEEREDLGKGKKGKGTLFEESPESAKGIVNRCHYTRKT